MKPGDQVRIFPDFLEGDQPEVGIIIRESTWEDGYQRKRTPPWEEKWWVVLLGEEMIHMPKYNFRLVE